MNKVILIGNITKDIELRYTQSEKAVASFGLATNDGWGENKKTNFHNIIAWNKTAEALSQYCKKGSKISVDGHLEYREWEKDGQKRYRTEIIANDVEFLDKKEQSQNATSQQDIPLTDFEEDDLPF